MNASPRERRLARLTGLPLATICEQTALEAACAAELAAERAAAPARAVWPARDYAREREQGLEYVMGCNDDDEEA